MKFNIDDMGKVRQIGEVQIGDVYPAKGGSRQKIAMWVVVGIRGNMCHLIGLNNEGEISSTSSYGIWAMERRELIGHCPEVVDLVLTVKPLP